MVEDGESDPEGSEKRLSHVFETKAQGLIYAKRPGVYNHDTHGRDLFHVSVLEMTMQRCMKSLTWEGSLMTDEQHYTSAEGGRAAPG